MIKLRRRTLPAAEQAILLGYQNQLAGVGRNSPVIRTMWNRFTKDDQARPYIAARLRAHSAVKCMYCETNSAKTIDHYYPKLKYPQFTFAWDNLLWACGPCNLAKRNEFPLQGRRGPLFLNPMVDDPIEFFVINLDTGWMSPRPGIGRAAARRARATIDQFKLNRVDLPEQRRRAARWCLRHLALYMKDPCRETEETVVQELSLAERHRAVVRQIMCRPSGDIRPLVEFCLTNSGRVQRCIRALNW